jgi:hypothetical protein
MAGKQRHAALAIPLAVIKNFLDDGAHRLGVTLAIGSALDRTWDVPQPRRAGFVSSRLRGLLALASVGAVNVLATVEVGLATAGGGERRSRGQQIAVRSTRAPVRRTGAKPARSDPTRTVANGPFWPMWSRAPLATSA